MTTPSTTINIMAKDSQQYCGFRLGKDLLAVPVLSVQEILKPQAVTPIPLAPPAVSGLINLRGQIVTAVDLRTFFGLSKRETPDSYMNVIILFDNELMALEVDEIYDVIAVNPSSFEAVPATLPPHLKPYVKGVHKLEKQLLIVLDIQKLLEAEQIFKKAT